MLASFKHFITRHPKDIQYNTQRKNNYFLSKKCPKPVFLYKLWYIIGFGLVGISILTNQKPTRHLVTCMRYGPWCVILTDAWFHVYFCILNRLEVDNYEQGTRWRFSHWIWSTAIWHWAYSEHYAGTLKIQQTSNMYWYTLDKSKDKQLIK